MASKISSLGGAVVGGVFLWAAFLWFTSPSSDQTLPVQTANAETVAPATSAPAQPVGFDDPDHEAKNLDVPKSACQKSLACTADQQLGWTKVSCKEAVENQSQYQVKWTDGMFHPLFGIADEHWQSPSDHDVIYVGNRLEVQNQFGAFERMNYRCVWNTQTQKVVSIEIQPASV